MSVIPIFIDSTDNERDLVLVEELPVILVKSAVRKVDEEQDAENSGSDGHQTEDDENPSPTLQAADTILHDRCLARKTEGRKGAEESYHLLEAVREDTRKARGNQSQAIEAGITLLHVVPRIPGGDEVDATGEVTSFEETQDQSQRDQLPPMIDETEADHDHAPSKANSR